MYTFQQVTLTAKHSDTWLSILFINRVSYLLVYVLANYLRIRHEYVTLFSLLLGVAASYFYFLGTYQNLEVAAILFSLSVIFDSVDGKLAKLTNTSSLLGRVLDKMRDKIVHFFCVVGLALGQTSTQKDMSFLVLALIYVLLSLLNLALSFYFLKTIAIKRRQKTFSLDWISSSIALEATKPMLLFRQRAFPIPGVTEWTTALLIIFPLVNNVRAGFFVAYLLTGYSILFLTRELRNVRKLKVASRISNT